MTSLGHCPACARPFTAPEVAGWGVLRARSARKGGPILEFSCPGCGRMLRLLPHGDGRYALPGEPPPQAVAPEERRPHWIQDPPEAPPEQPPTAPEEAPEAVGAPPPPAREVPQPGRSDAEAPETDAEAWSILGLEAGASTEEMDSAFHRRSKTCHPDKVAHMDTEFQELAERKFRRLRAAYERLRR